LWKQKERREEMKKLMVFLMGLGLGLVLIAGGFETSQAQEKSSVFQKTTLSNDSLRVQPLQERVNNNSNYLKPPPVKPMKVAGEVLLGGLGALLGGIAVGIIGFNITYDEENDDWMNFSGWTGAIAGYVVGSNLGSAAGVYLIGNSGGEKGSYRTTLVGSFAGTLVGGVTAIALLKDDDEGTLPFAVFTSAQVTGATIGFNLSRKGKKIDAYSEALLNLNDGKLAFAFPQVDVYPDSFGSGKYKVNLFQARF
jgi:hypothetical protein